MSTKSKPKIETPEPGVISFRAIGALRKWARNYHKGDVALIRGSIARFGFNGVLRVWHGTVMAGNHSLTALEELKAAGHDAPKGIQVVAGEWLAPCLDISHLSEREAEAFAVVDNRAAELADTDPAKLLQLLEEMDGTTQEIVGYNDDDLADLLKAIEPHQGGSGGGGEFANPGEGDANTQCPQCGFAWKA